MAPAATAPTTSSTPPRRPATRGAASRSTGLTKEWHGLPTWAWVGIGGLAVAGLYVFIRGYRKAAANSTTAADTTGTSAGAGGGWTMPPVQTPPVSAPAPAPSPGVTAPAPALPPAYVPPIIPAGSPGHIYSIQDVRDIFARYGFSSLAQIAAATFGPSTETGPERIDRIVRDLNNGTRSLAEVTNSISHLPGAAGSGMPAMPAIPSVAPALAQPTETFAPTATTDMFGRPAPAPGWHQSGGAWLPPWAPNEAWYSTNFQQLAQDTHGNPVTWSPYGGIGHDPVATVAPGRIAPTGLAHTN